MLFNIRASKDGCFRDLLAAVRGTHGLAQGYDAGSFYLNNTRNEVTFLNMHATFAKATLTPAQVDETKELRDNIVHQCSCCKMTTPCLDDHTAWALTMISSFSIPRVHWNKETVLRDYSLLYDRVKQSPLPATSQHWDKWSKMISQESLPFHSRIPPNLIKHLFAEAAEELGPDHLDSICQRDLVARNTQQALQGVREDAATRHKDSQRLRSQRIWYPCARGRMQLACLICSSPGRGGRQFLLR